MAEITAGFRCPTLRQPMPPARSMKTLPSTSSMSAPWDLATYTRVACERPRGTACSRRRCNSWERGPGTAVHKRIHSISVPPDGRFVEVDVDQLGFEVFFEAPGAELAAEAGLLESSPGRFHVGGLHVVDPDDSGANLLHGTEGLEDVAGPDGGGEAVRRVVSDLHGVGFVIEGNNAGDGAEDFFAGDAGTIVHIVKDGG